MKFINNGNYPIFSDFIDRYESKLNSSVPEFEDIDIKLFKFSAADYVKHVNANNPFHYLPFHYDPYNIDDANSPFMVDDKKNEIYYIYDLCDKITSRDEQYALMLHEVGHIYNRIIGKSGDKEEEPLADEFACRFICRKHLINAIFKMVKDDRFKGNRTELIERIRAIKAGRKFFCWRH